MITKADIQLVRSLSDKRVRDEEGLFVAEGEKLIGELRESQFQIEQIYALEGVMSGYDVQTLSPKEMERISHLKSAASCLALVRKPDYKPNIETLKKRLILALDEVQNPGNMGTIIRLADWFGIEDIICTHNSADCFNPKVVQATMGAILRVRVHYVDLSETLRELKDQGVPIYGAMLEGENIYRSELSAEGVILMGNEGRGVSEQCAQSITHKLYIPPYPADCAGSESLNVAMATGIICSEFRRRMG